MSAQPRRSERTDRSTERVAHDADRDLSDRASVVAAAATLWRLWSAGELAAELPCDQSPADLDEAWAIQRALEGLAGPRIGWKIASTSERSRQTLGLTEPLAGALYQGVLVPNGSAVRPTTLGIVEAEFAFRMRAGLDPARAPFSREAVLDHVTGVHAGMEVPDTRLLGYPHLSAPQMVADFMLARYYTVGARLDVEPSALRHVEVILSRDGLEEARGTGADVLGDPANALLWLANSLSERGERIVDGDLITTGACAVAEGVQPGESVSATFAGLEAVTLSLSGS